MKILLHIAEVILKNTLKVDLINYIDIFLASNIIINLLIQSSKNWTQNEMHQRSLLIIIWDTHRIFKGVN